MEEYYTVQQASKLLGISVSSFRKAVYAGKYPYGICKIGSTRRYWSKRDLGLLNEEMWKPVVSYEGLYEVSNIGRIRNIRGKLVKQSMTVSGYKRVTLRKNNIAKTKLAHRLVAEAFIPNPDNYNIVNHKDENKFNNNVENLEWCTQSYNSSYSSTYPTKTISSKYRVLKVSLDGKYITGMTIKQAARELNMSEPEFRKAFVSSKLINNYIWIKIHLS